VGLARLGNLLYPLRGLEFARELQDYPERSKRPISAPAVVGAVINLGYCLDLTSSMGIRAVEASHKSFVALCEAEGRALPHNRGGPDRLMRNLDCAVVNHLHKVRKDYLEKPFDTVRGIFMEGGPIYAEAGFQKKTHIQICVRTPECIKGVFRVPPRDLA
jgi:hypothetical protein